MQYYIILLWVKPRDDRKGGWMLPAYPSHTYMPQGIFTAEEAVEQISTYYLRFPEDVGVHVLAAAPLTLPIDPK